MTIGELFINLGVKGASAVGKTLTGVQKGMGDVVSSSLAAKAAILGVIVGLERLTGFASQIGMDLNKFAVTTGLSTDELQKWQYAMGRFDVSADETASTIKGVQNAMTDMMLGKGAPGSLDLLASKVGFDPKKANDTFYVMKKLQDFAKTQPPGVAHNLLKDFGITDNVFQAMKNMNLEVDKISKKDIINQKQIKQLTDINKAWKDFWFSLRTMGVKIVATEGLGAVQQLAGAFRLLIDAGKYVLDLVEKFKLLKLILAGIGIALAIYFAPLTATVAGLVLLLADIQKYREGKDSVVGTIGAGVSETAKGLKQNAWSDFTSFFKKGSMSPDAFGGGGLPSVKDAVTPVKIESKDGTGKATGAPTMNTTIHIDGAEHPQTTGKAVQKAISDAARQIHSQAGGI